ncbi:unnamed protein product [Caenorhabditis angaria]|uniref:G-protein coupled receptors family 1 profile domain-containing protein n=1 Tax=Caenorhabditis angaria TaxID=860376 RepID=A0A9P1INT6_9PELO|nr:unnamed protein product [Caenorhabditis angaria]
MGENIESPTSNQTFCPPTSLCRCDDVYEKYFEAEKLVIGIFVIPIIIFGILANITSVRVFTHRIMASSSINWYLAVLSASDTVILVSSFFVLTLPRFGEFFSFWIGSYISYSLTPYMFPIMTTAQTCSVYMTVGVSIHRYIGVCHPYKSVEWLPKKRVTWFIAGLIAFSSIYNIPKFFEVRVADVCYRKAIDYYLPLLRPTEMRNSDMYMLIYQNWISIIVMYFIPFALLIGLNSRVLGAVRRSRKMHMVSQCGTEGEEFSKKADRKERQTSIMLISIVVIFIACNTLSFVCNILEIMKIEDELLEYMVLVNNTLVIINASSNIAIYMLFSDKYRTLLRYYIFCDWSRHGELLIDKSQA